jgi:hypothetical protein
MTKRALDLLLDFWPLVLAVLIVIGIAGMVSGQPAAELVWKPTVRDGEKLVAVYRTFDADPRIIVFKDDKRVTEHGKSEEVLAADPNFIVVKEYWALDYHKKPSPIPEPGIRTLAIETLFPREVYKHLAEPKEGRRGALVLIQARGTTEFLILTFKVRRKSGNPFIDATTGIMETSK